jgi:hypothetical protein
MPAQSRRPSGNYYQLKITLRGTKPPIWRRVLVPAECNLEALHAVIQDAMGWEDDHLHAFHIDDEEYMGRDPMGGKPESDGEDAYDYRLSDVVREPKAKFTYEYDFGDSWEHLITVEKILTPEDAAKLNLQHSFACLAGELACPPEDCGGVWGYYHLLETLKNPKSEEYEDMKEWAGDFDPEAFDLNAVNKRLARIKFR